MRINNPNDRLTLKKVLGGEHWATQTIGYGKSVAGFHGRDERSVEISLVIGDPRDVSRTRIAVVLSYAFIQLGVARLTARIAVSNERSWRLAERFGFKREGVLRRGASDGDAYLYSMLVEEFACLMKRLLRVTDGKFTEAARAYQPRHSDCAGFDSPAPCH